MGREGEGIQLPQSKSQTNEVAKDGTIHRFTKKLPVRKADRIMMTVLFHAKKAHTDSDWVSPPKGAESDSEQEDNPKSSNPTIRIAKIL